MSALLIALLFSVAEAVNGPVPAKVMVNNGKLRLVPLKGESMVYENGETDLLLAPQTVLKSLAGTCIVKVGETQFILDENDSLAYESGENGMAFRCMDGSIEAVFGDKTRKLGQGEVIALNSLAGEEESQDMAGRARSLELRFGPTAIGFPSTTGPAPLQGVAFTSKSPWKEWYGGITPSQTWASVSPYW